MAGTNDGAETPTRRAYLKYGGTLVGAGLLAGCSGAGSESPSTDATSESGTEAGEEAETEAETDSETAGGDADGPYSVSMSPMGEVEFDAVPERVFTVFPQYADMAVALGHGDAVNAVYVPEMSGTTMNHYYHHLDGVSFDWEGLHDPLADGLPKELLFELDSDVHLADPA